MESITWSKCYWPQAKAKLIDTGEAFKSSALVSASVSGPDPGGSTGGPTATGAGSRFLGFWPTVLSEPATDTQQTQQRQGGVGGGGQ